MGGIVNTVKGGSTVPITFEALQEDASDRQQRDEAKGGRRTAESFKSTATNFTTATGRDTGWHR
jgi:hypothetical protein